jgi:endonuclease/exonuclease/phosphatase family metal-dependent hydrolase
MGSTAGDVNDVTVMTRNLYLGADLAPVLSADSPAALVAGAGAVWATVQATNFPERAGALAAEIAAAEPDLVGLQEVTIWRIQSPSDQFTTAPTPATTVAYDFLALLLDSLTARGLAYTPAATSTNFDAELPAAVGPATVLDVRLTDRDVILARAGVAVSSPRAGTYAAKVTFPLGGPGGQPVAVPRGWTSVVARTGGRAFRFVNTHLEVEGFAPVNEAQAGELLTLLAGERLPVILAGDFNSAADGSSTASYAALTAAGYADAWGAAEPTAPGLTCCHDERLRNPAPLNSKRIDFVFARGARPVAADVVGDEPADRTTSGLWPSDHSGVVAALRFPNPANRRPVLTEVLAYTRDVIEPATGLAGDLLRFRLTDLGDRGPWALRIDWGDGTVHRPTVLSAGTLSFLRTTSYPGPGRYTITISATDAAGSVSMAQTVTINER